MGEFATFGGREIKIGTCENMYYLRFDQRDQVRALDGNVDPVADVEEIRFRFPWPDEDAKEPGPDSFKDYNKGLAIHGVELPKGVDHGSVQFTAPGYVVSLPCPEVENGPESDHGLKIHRNGHPGPIRVVQQRYVRGELLTVCECGGCGARFRLADLAMALPVINAIRKLAATERHRARVRPGTPATTEEIERSGRWFEVVADRIESGYHVARALGAQGAKGLEL